MRRVRIAASERSDGDLHPHHVPPAVLSDRQHDLIGSRVAIADQVHGVEARRVSADFDWPVLGQADVLITTEAPIGIWAADCAPIFLISTSGAIVGAHGGWRGLAAGVIDVAVAQMHAAGEQVASAVVGPVIHPCCYEFDAADVVEVARGVHADPATLEGVTRHGKLALDVPAALRAGLAVHRIEVGSIGPCTGCTDRWFSHRARTDTGRHAVLAWASAST